MRNHKRQFLFEFFKSFDLFIVLVSLFVAIQLNFKNSFSLIEMRLNYHNFIFGFFLLLIGYQTLKNLGAYDSKRFRPFSLEVNSCLGASFVSSAYISVIGLLFHSGVITFSSVVTYSIVCALLLILNHMALYLFLKAACKFGRNLRYVLIAGTNARAIKMSEDLPKLGYVVKGFIDTCWRCPGTFNAPLITDFNKIFREQSIDEVIICLPIKTEYGYIQSIIDATEEQGILTRLSTDLFDLKIAKAKIEYFEDVPLLTLFTGNMYRKMVIIKEIFDILVAGVFFVLTLPILIITAIVVKVTSKGPVLFFQERLGINKRLFKVIKFRTMVPNAELKLKDLEVLNDRKNEATFKMKNDPRVTKIGKFLRLFSIDELPQLINVIKGDMSLVGPRPLPVRDYKGFDKNWQRRRFSVRPGITCIWQVSGRDDISFEQWMKMDNEYIDNWSLWLDIKILLKTIPTVLFAKGSS
jgi:exopolysaccharide biosynthesis polyprenyl glycosylphosphotransferase